MFMEKEIREILKRYWGYEEFRSLQEEIICSVISGKDTLALMPTGGGKSITYQVAALARQGMCLVITPLIALMKDQTEDLKKRGISAEAIYTGMQREQVESVINKCIYNDIRFLYVSPERLASEKFRMSLKQMPVSFLAVDEAHCISQWGYDFRPSYLQIAEVRSLFPQAPILALTATATPEVAADIREQLKFADYQVFSKSFKRENLVYVVRKANDKLGELEHILSALQGSAIVYVRKRDTAEQLARFLNSKNIRAEFYHAGLSSLLREKRQEDWKEDKTPVIVATNAFGMGIDKPNVRVVVHFDIPDSPEAYFQEAGRAGRDGKKAYVVLLTNPASVTALKTRITKGFPEKSYIKKVYEALGNYFQIAEGAGKGYAFEFNPELFVKNFELDHAKTHSAIQILQLEGYLECTDDVNSRSRICFIVSRDALNDFVADTEFQEKLLVLLMRKYAGIFTQYIYINEQYLADEMGFGRQAVYESLMGLARRKIISYIPGNDRPYIIYHQPRLPLSYLTIHPDVYEKRKNAYATKVNEMVRYVEDAGKCRQLFLMRYFGQKDKVPCGICDLCLQKKKKQGKATKKQIDEVLLHMLEKEERNIRELVRSFEEEQELVIERIRHFLDEGVFYYKSPFVLALKKGKNDYTPGQSPHNER